tara:strand:- start:2730 stop:3317 length:588 start_codon:yes stop_codon:yes gene_type:complete
MSEIISVINQLDFILLSFFNSTLSNPFFNFIFPIITNAKNWIYIILLFYAILIFKYPKKGLLTFLLTLICVIITDAICAQLLKPYFSRIRPSHELYENINLLIGKGGIYSFPSNHAANTMALTFTTSFFFKKTFKYLFVISLIIGFSRIYVGVHYPFDVFFGFIFGFIISKSILHFFSELKIYFIKPRIIHEEQL